MTEPPGDPPATLRDEVVELRLLRVLGPAHAAARPPELRFLAAAPEYRYAIHRLADGVRVGRIHLRVTADPAIVEILGHAGYAVDPEHRGRGYASRALTMLRRIARQAGVAPLRVFIAPDNVASRRTAERAGLELVDEVEAAPEALALGLERRLCRYRAREP